MAIHIDVLAEINRREMDRQADAMADRMERAGKTAGDEWTAGFAEGVDKNNPKIVAALDRSAAATNRVTSAQMAYNRVTADGKATEEQTVNARNRLSAAMTTERESWEKTTASMAKAREEAIRTHREYDVLAGGLQKVSTDMAKFGDDIENVAAKGLRDVERGSAAAADGMRGLSRSFGLPPAAVAALAAIGPLLIDTAEVAVTASQSILLLPAAAAAAGAGMLTLSIATDGFDKAIKDIRDPKKFATDIAGFSPVMQQAALSIRNLLPEIDNLRHATQDSFFEGFSGEIDKLVKTFDPSIQQLTTSIAGSFNTMITGVAEQLMTPENLGNINEIITNIENAFHNLEPAAKAVAQALLDITSAGSGFLPGLATDISNAAQEFANFISEARKTGQLQEWINEGIQAVKLLGQAVYDVGHFIMEAFGSDAHTALANFQRDLNGIESVTNLLNGDLSSMSNSNLKEPGFLADMREELDKMTGIAAAVRDGFNNLNLVFDVLEARAIQIADSVKHALEIPIDLINKMISGLNSLPGLKPDIPLIPKAPDIDNQVGRDLDSGKIKFHPWDSLPENTAPNRDDDNHYTGDRDPTSKTGTHTWIDPKTGKTNVLVPGLGWVPSDDPRASTRGGNPGLFDVPTAPEKGSKKDALDSIKAGLDPNSYKVDPFAPVGGLPIPGSLPGKTSAYGIPGTPGAPGMTGAVNPFGVDQQAVLEANETVLKSAHKMEEDKKTLLALQKENGASQEDIEKAQWSLQEDGWALQKAQADLVEKQRGTTKSLKSGMTELGAALDPDFGLSKGLAGFVENLTKFVGNVALAGPLAKMQATANASPIQGGYGLLGINGANNMAAGLSPLLGRPYSAGGFGGPAAADSAYGAPGGGISIPNMPGDKATMTRQEMASLGIPALYQNPAGGGSPAIPQWVQDIAHQYGGPDLVAGSTPHGNADGSGLHGVPGSAGYAVDITGPQAQQDALAQFFKANPELSAMMIHQGADGTPYGINGGQDVSGRFFNTAGGTYGDEAGMVHWAPSFAPGGGAPGQGAPGGAPGGAPNWDAVAQAESSGNWSNADTGNNGHYGGLQFSPQTWRAYGGQGNPQDATRDQQIAIANNTAFNGYNGTPPQGLSAWETITKGMVPGIGTNTPAGAGWGMGGGDVPQGGGNAGPGGQGPYLPPVQGPGTLSWGHNAPGTLSGTPGGSGIGDSAGTPIGGLAPVQNQGSGTGIGLTPGGTLDTALGMAASAFPGLGQAAQTGVKLASRAIQFGGQAAGIITQGALDTILPTGGSALAQNSWLTRIVGGLAGATPALPNMAGGDKNKQIQGPLTPQEALAQHFGDPQAAGNTANIVVNNNNASPDQNGKALAYHWQAANPVPAGTGGAYGGGPPA